MNPPGTRAGAGIGTGAECGAGCRDVVDDQDGEPPQLLALASPMDSSHELTAFGTAEPFLGRSPERRLQVGEMR